MFRVTFRDAQYNSDLTTTFLPAIPTVGEPVYLYEQASRPATAKSYRVASRHWHIMKKEPEESTVVIALTPED